MLRPAQLAEEGTVRCPRKNDSRIRVSNPGHHCLALDKIDSVYLQSAPLDPSAAWDRSGELRFACAEVLFGEWWIRNSIMWCPQRYEFTVAD
nr:hypothetical protein OG781_39055 [Streptomyces sp. NBC_00830]